MRAIPVLQSERLRIRPFQSADRPQLFAIKQAIGWVDVQKTERNPFPDPPWLQTVGILENPQQ